MATAAPAPVPLKSFTVLYRFKTRPSYGKGVWKTQEKVFTARDLMDALWLAKKYAESNFPSKVIIEAYRETT